MYITFLIGNGFDLNLGLKTKYKDFLEVYTSELKTENDNILSYFKNELKKCTNESESDKKYKEILRKIGALESCMDILEGSGFFDKLFHICCFSTERDLLSQWAMYADNGTGVAIGFNRDMFMNYVNVKKLDFIQVNYSLNQFIDIANEKIDKVLSEYNTDTTKNKSCYLKFMNFIVEEIIKKAYYYKNEHFEQEHEYRLVYNSAPWQSKITEDETGIYEQKIDNEKNKLTSLGDTIYKINYYISKGKMVSYRPLCFRSLNGWISEIIIGPKSSITCNDVKFFLQINGIHLSDDCIIKSKITYQ